MAAPKRYWIKGAIKKPGALTAQAKREGGYDYKRGKIKSAWLQRKLASPKTSATVKRRVRLAKTLKGF